MKREVVSNDPIDSVQSTPARGARAFVRRHWLALLVVVVAIVLAVALARYIKHKNPVSAPGGRRGGQDGAVAVSVATAAAGDIQVRIPALGTVTPLARTCRTGFSPAGVTLMPAARTSRSSGCWR